MMGIDNENIDVQMTEEAFRASRVHKLMGNPLRYRKYKIIGAEEPVGSGELAERLDRGLDDISYHADKLKERDLIFTQKKGRKSLHHIKRNDIYKAVLNFEKLFLR